ncbi:MAG TPA: DNA translocase FtsK 4TM domain-containing protein [Anaerolineales bacterium]
MFKFFSRPKKRKPQRKTHPKAQARAKPSNKAMPPPEPLPPEPSFWDRLSSERKLDITGIILAIAGILILLTLFASSRSLFTADLMLFLGQIFGWGIYILPVALFIFGVWLILRRNERLPALSLERTVGSILLYVWLLTTMHSIIAQPVMADVAANDGAGGGYIGGLFERLLFFGFGFWGAVIILIAWFLIALTMTLDITMQDLFRGMATAFTRMKSLWIKPALPPASPTADATTNGYTPLKETPDASPILAALPNIPTVTTTTSAPVIQWVLPQINDILDPGSAPSVNEEFINQRARLIEETLASFSAPAQVVEISRGPTITQFGVEPLFVETRSGRTRVRVSKIASLADDLALALAAPRIRIQAPVPGHSYVGIEVPNEEMALVALRDVLENETFQRNKTALRFALGQDVAGHPIAANLEAMPHMLIAGTTGSGKSVCVNSILSCFLLNNTPDDLRLVLVDPKRVELTGYNGIPHLLSPVVVEVESVVSVLQWMTREMDKRYHDFAKVGARNITDYNARMKAEGKKKLPFLLIVIDELADLMMIAPTETESAITRLAQLARATGIHMILATQRPSVDVVTGLIKANFPARIAFAVASGVDSRVILDQPGAERLLGRGDMLYQAPDAPAPARLQGVFVSDHEIQKLVEFWKTQAAASTPYAVTGSPVGALPENVPLKQKPLWEEEASTDGDPLLNDAIDIIRREGRASVSMLQRRMRIGYTRAARLMDVMEERGIVGPPEGNTQVRQVLNYGPAATPKDE